MQRWLGMGGVAVVLFTWTAVAGAQNLSASVATGASGARLVADHSLSGSGHGPRELERPAASEILDRVLKRNQERLAELARYESERTYRVEYSGTGGEHKAELRVRIAYTGPNQKQFTVESESGSKFLCENVLRKLVDSEREASMQGNRTQMALSSENYDAELVGEDTVGTVAGPVPAWVLRVSPRVDNKFTYRGKVWISKDDDAVVKIEAEPAKNPSWWISRASFESDYMRRGDVWLPVKNVSHSHVRVGGEATLTIEYGTYPVVVEAQRAAAMNAENIAADAGSEAR